MTLTLQLWPQDFFRRRIETFVFKKKGTGKIRALESNFLGCLIK